MYKLKLSVTYPGGLVEKDESLKEAAIREIKEEVGVSVSPDDFECVHIIHVRKNDSNTQDIIGVYFRTRVWQGVACNNEPNKITDAQWFDLSNLPTAITDHAKQAINGIIRGILYSEHG